MMTAALRTPSPSVNLTAGKPRQAGMNRSKVPTD